MRRLALLALAAPLLLASPLWAQDPAAAAPAPMAGHAHAMGPATGAGGGCGGGGENCPCMAMMAKMDSANVQIAALTEAMNKASGSKKTDAMAALLNAMVQDRLMMQGLVKMMHTHMEKQMMGGMGGMGGWVVWVVWVAWVGRQPARRAPIAARRPAGRAVVQRRPRSRRSSMLDAAIGLAVAALVGLAVGIERQWSGHAVGPDARFAGCPDLFPARRGGRPRGSAFG